MNGIQMKDISFGYEDGMVLEQVSLTIEEGDFAGIIGSNGAGKSTLIKLMLGQLMPKKGTVLATYARIGYVPQVGFAVKADFPATVREIVMLNLFQTIGLFKRPNKVHYKMADEALETVGMLDQAEKQLGMLSGGQQQRVMIAKALVASPQILILDEPMACVDAENEKMLYELLNYLNKEKNITIIMVTHAIEEIEESMNKIFIIKDKRLSRRK